MDYENVTITARPDEVLNVKRVEDGAAKLVRRLGEVYARPEGRLTAMTEARPM